jgi:hypothetical protein
MCPGGKGSHCQTEGCLDEIHLRRPSVPARERSGGRNPRRVVPVSMRGTLAFLPLSLGRHRVFGRPIQPDASSMRPRVPGAQMCVVRSEPLENGRRHVPGVCGHGWKDQRARVVRVDVCRKCVRGGGGLGVVFARGQRAPNFVGVAQMFVLRVCVASNRVPKMLLQRTKNLVETTIEKQR